MTDAPKASPEFIRQPGTGLACGWLCMGCNTKRGDTRGSKGKGALKRCRFCVEARQARKEQA